MASQANIVINDGETTPVAHTYYPDGAGWVDSVGGIVADWVDRSQAAAVGYWRLKQIFKRPDPKRGRKNYVVSHQSSCAVLENVTNSTVSGIAPAPTVAYTPGVTTTWGLPERSTTQARKNLLTIHRNFLANAAVTSAVQDLEAAT